MSARQVALASVAVVPGPGGGAARGPAAAPAPAPREPPPMGGRVVIAHAGRVHAATDALLLAAGELAKAVLREAVRGRILFYFIWIGGTRTHRARD